jgi:hypothetical protein
LPRIPAGQAEDMTVTDPDVPDPLNDPRTTQADPGAYAEGEDLASTEDDPAVTGEEELDEGGLPEVGGVPSSSDDPVQPAGDTGEPFTQVAPPS